MKRVYLVLGAVLASATWVEPAAARCAAPEPAIVWSYPAQGDTDVPTNADLWLLMSGWGGPPRVLLDGVELKKPSFEVGYDLGALKPRTLYKVDVEVTNTADDSVMSLELEFTTGAGPASADDSAAPGRVEASRRGKEPMSGLCHAALWTQDCFDTGQDTHFVFDPSGSAEGWLIVADTSDNNVDLWPAECGAPRLFAHRQSQPCVRLYGIDATGKAHGGQRVCSTKPPPQEQADGGDATDTMSDDGCSVISPHAGGARFSALAGLVALAAWVRLRRRARDH